MIRIGICDDLVEQLQIQEEMVRNIVCRLGLNTEIKCFQNGTKRQYGYHSFGY